MHFLCLNEASVLFLLKEQLDLTYNYLSVIIQYLHMGVGRGLEWCGGIMDTVLIVFNLPNSLNCYICCTLHLQCCEISNIQYNVS